MLMGNDIEVVVEKDGRLSIPQDILLKLGINEGDTIGLVVEDEKIIMKKIVRKKIFKKEESQPPLHLLYRPEITKDLLSGEELKRDLNLEARLMTIPLFTQLAKRGFFIISGRNRSIAFGFRTVEEAIDYFLSQGKITKDDLIKAGIDWPTPSQ